MRQNEFDFVPEIGMKVVCVDGISWPMKPEGPYKWVPATGEVLTISDYRWIVIADRNRKSETYGLFSGVYGLVFEGKNNMEFALFQRSLLTGKPIFIQAFV